VPFAPIPEVVTAISRGELVVLVDDEERENEGDLVMAAEHASGEAIAFMATRGCGLICLAMEGPMLDRLGLPLMTRDNRSRLATAFTLSIDAADGITTGISAADRLATVRAAIDEDARPEHVVSPGHIFPLRAVEGGVLRRAGHSEASVDLARHAGCRPAALICEIMKPDGTMARLDDLVPYCEEHGLLLASIADLIAWREERESLVEVVADDLVETAHGRFRACCYRSTVTGNHHLALVLGDDLGPGSAACPDPVLVRVHKQRVLGDVFGTRAAQEVDVDACLGRIAEAGRGLLLYLHDERGGDLAARLASGGHSPGMDPRDYGTGAQILRDLGVRRMRLLTRRNPHPSALSGHGLEIVERVDPGEKSAP